MKITFIICLIMAAFTLAWSGAIVWNTLRFRKKILATIKADLDNNPKGFLLDYFHPEVIKVYLDYKAKPDSWQSEYATVQNGTDRIWSANCVENRKFYAHSTEYFLNEKYEKINETLTYWDRLLLDLIVKSILKRQAVIKEAAGL